MSNDLNDSIKRYCETKHIAEIILDMGLSSSHIREKLEAYNSQIQQLLSTTLKEQQDILDKLQVFYQEASELLEKSEELYTTTKEKYNFYLSQQNPKYKTDIRSLILSIEKQLTWLADTKDTLNDHIRRAIAKISSPKEQQQHTHQANNFCLYFNDVYNDLDSLCVKLEQLRKQL